MDKVLVIGASKGIGLAVTKEALARGYRIRAMARTAETMPLAHDNLEKVNGSALSSEDVAAALAGVSTVVLTLGVALNPQTVLKPTTFFSRATAVIVSAMERAGVRRLVCVTGFGSGDSRASMGTLESIPFRLVLGRVYDDKSVQEGIIEGSGLDWVIARPGILTNGAKGKYRILADRASWRNGIISRANVADFMVGQVEGTSYLRKAPVLIS